MIIYKKDTGEIIDQIPDNQTIESFFHHYPQEFKDGLDCIYGDNFPKNLAFYRVINNVLVQKSELEVQEIKQYGKVLTENERVIYKKEELIKISKAMLAEFLEQNPLLFADGKYYSVTAEKQGLLNNAIAVYQMKIQSGLPAELKWNSTGEECTLWTLEGITALALTIANYIEPLVTYQQALEVQIKSCTTKEELDGIVIDYESV